MGEIVKSSWGFVAAVVGLVLLDGVAKAVAEEESRTRRLAEEAKAEAERAERLARRDRDTRIAGVQRRREAAAAEYRGWVNLEGIAWDAGRDPAQLSVGRREAGEALLRIDAELSALLASR